MCKCLLFSGGLDSACAWWVLGKPPCLFVGGPSGPARDAGLGEARALDYMGEIHPPFRKALRVAKVDCTPFMRAGSWMFSRDQVCALAAWGAGFDGVMIGWCQNDGATKEHVERQSQEMRFAVSSTWPFSVEFPVWHMTKAELIAAALEAGAPLAFLQASHSCVVQSNGHCGKCENCIQRAEAFQEVMVA